MLTLLVEKRDWFFDLLLQHIGISLVSIALAALIGLSLGIAIAAWRRGTKPVLALVNFVYTIPSIALFGFLIPVTGIGDLTAVVALTIYALLPMVRGTYAGLAAIDPAIVEAARGMGSTDRQLLYRIELPLAAPVIMSSIRTMATMTIALTGIASFIGAGGLGVAIYRGITTNNLAMTLAGSVLIALLAIAVDALLAMLMQAQSEGLTSWQISAGYRSVAYQQKLFDDKVYSYRQQGMTGAQARSAARKLVAEPGCSEHHTGLAFDITVPGTSFGGTKQAKWLEEHCWEWGFILRYPADKQDVTGIIYESWHYRFVGKTHAKLMKESGLCLEEYLQQEVPEDYTGIADPYADPQTDLVQ